MRLVTWIEPKADFFFFFFKVHISADAHICNDIWEKKTVTFDSEITLIALIFHFIWFYPFAFTEMKYSLIVWVLDNIWNGFCHLSC